MNYSYYDFLSTTCVALIVPMYFLLQSKKIKSNALMYSSLNAVGALQKIILLIFELNISAFIIESL